MYEFKKMNNVHIGSIIKRKVNEKGISVSKFAEKLNCTRATVYGIFEQEHINTHRLVQISEILNYNFFSEFCKSADNLNSHNFQHE
jgi:plasmid maintenance system antidote protein VapI